MKSTLHYFTLARCKSLSHIIIVVFFHYTIMWAVFEITTQGDWQDNICSLWSAIKMYSQWTKNLDYQKYFKRLWDGIVTVVMKATWNCSSCHSQRNTGDRTASNIISRESAAWNKNIFLICLLCVSVCSDRICSRNVTLRSTYTSIVFFVNYCQQKTRST